MGRVRLESLTSGRVRLESPTSGRVRLESSTSGRVRLESLTSGRVRLESLTSGRVRLESLTSGRVRLESLTSGRVRLESLTYENIRLPNWSCQSCSADPADCRTRSHHKGAHRDDTEPPLKPHSPGGRCVVVQPWSSSRAPILWPLRTTPGGISTDGARGPSPRPFDRDNTRPSSLPEMLDDPAPHA